MSSPKSLPSESALKISRLAASSYHSPFTRSGAPKHPDAGKDEPYASLRAKALSDLTEMGYDPSTMVERGVVWAEDQDPFGHVMNTAYPHFFGINMHRVMESFDQWLDEKEYNLMIQGKSIAPVLWRYEMELKRPVTYPDSLIVANRLQAMLPDRSNGITSLYSLKQQAFVAEVTGWIVFMDLKTGRPVDLRTLKGGWPELLQGFLDKAKNSKEKWNQWQAAHGGSREESEHKLKSRL